MFSFLFLLFHVMLCFRQHQVTLYLFVWVDNLAHEQHVFCTTLYDAKHKCPIELQDGDVLKGHKRDTNACGGCSSGSNLIDIQGSLVHNLWCNEGTVI